MVCRKTLERISWRVRYFSLEGPVFLPGESGISSWRVRYFFLESPVFLPGESGISSWRVRYFFLESPVFLPGESGISSWRVRYFRGGPRGGVRVLVDTLGDLQEMRGELLLVYGRASRTRAVRSVFRRAGDHAFALIGRRRSYNHPRFAWVLTELTPSAP